MSALTTRGAARGTPTRRRGPALALACGLVLALGGCAYVRGKVTAEDARGPVSLTPHVFDASGEVLTLGEELEEVGTFSTSETFIAWFYGLLPPTWTWDGSEFFNQQLDRYGGEAIVNLTAKIKESTGGEMLLSWFSQGNQYVPIWVDIELEGTVVKRKGAD